MATRSLGTIRHRSFAYLLLLAVAASVGLALSMLLRLALQPLVDNISGAGFWADFARGGIVTLALLPVPLALVAGRRLIRRFSHLVPESARRD